MASSIVNAQLCKSTNTWVLSLFSYAKITKNTHLPFDKARATFCLGAGLLPCSEGQTPVLANFLRCEIHSASDMPLCDFLQTSSCPKQLQKNYTNLKNI